MSEFGQFIERMRGHAGLWKYLFFLFLVAVFFINVFLRPAHPHVDQEAYPGFWALFGFGVGIVMIYALKRVFTHLVAVDEDFYERSSDK